MTPSTDEVLALLAAYGTALDAGRDEQFAGLFPEDGVLAVGERETVGSRALTGFAAGAPKGVHLTGLPSLDGDVASTPFTFLNSATGETVAGHYRDTFTRDAAGRLLLRRREITIAVRVPAAS